MENLLEKYQIESSAGLIGYHSGVLNALITYVSNRVEEEYSVEVYKIFLSHLLDILKQSKEDSEIIWRELLEKRKSDRLKEFFDQLNKEETPR